MTRYRNYLLGGLSALSLLTFSCKDDTFEEYENNSDEVTVSFTLASETALTASRKTPLTGTEQISDGSLIDMIIYAVYDKDYNLLTGYSLGSDFANIDHGEGQTIRKVENFPAELNITLKKDQEYHIAFWAQSSKTNAYDTSDLRKVEVKYSEIKTEPSDNGSSVEGDDFVPDQSEAVSSILNNDEYRDAFCRVIDIETSSTNIQQNVFLYRPLAQINVGTEGYDFELVNRDADKKYMYSKIRINRVARYLDVAKDSVYTSTIGTPGSAEAYAVVDFDYAPIPAYAYNKIHQVKIPDKPSYTTWDGDEAWFTKQKLNYDQYKYEQFLRVHLYSDEEKNSAEEGRFTEDANKNGWLDYASYTKYNDPDKVPDSETFKYLSMCYVLTSSGNRKQADSEVLNNVKVWLATDEKGSDEVEIVNINNVPVQRNWRTNIVGRLITEEANVTVKLDTDFAGEKDGNGVSGWELSGELAKGVYYDAEKDEIQISDVDGLIWFQRMVNGDMEVRASNKTTPGVGDPYRFYKAGNKNPIKFTYKGIDEPKDNPKLRERILIATHEYTVKNGERILNNWPKGNRFHFEPSDNNPATVKLMADIDLAGIEWIPIGMDYKVAELKKYYWIDGELMPNSSKGNKFFSKSKTDNRGFFGHFDGNGHTIYNLKTKRFGAQIDETYIEAVNNDNQGRNFDALPWMGRGLFGEIGGSAWIKNVNLVNVDIYGCNGVGGIVGIVYGDKIEIDNCSVDGGYLTATPLYRNNNANTKTFARGCFLGGIAGYFSTAGGKMTNCEVKNLVIKGYRKIGGLIGTLDIKQSSEGPNGEKTQGYDDISGRVPAAKGISNNSISNTIIIASQLHFPFGISPATDKSEINVGFGFDADTYDLYAGDLIGGDWEYFLQQSLQNYTSNNTISNVTYAPMTESYVRTGSVVNSKLTDKVGDIRISEIAGVPLEYMPPLSSWFTDSIVLNNNYYGNPSAYTTYNTTEFAPFSVLSKENKYVFPMQLPVEVEINWDTYSHLTGLYVESVSVDGKGGVGGRSVITPLNVDGDGESCMFVTARDRKNAGDIYGEKGDKTKNPYIKPTKIRNFVLRGQPYAWAGLLISPNENMDSVLLEDVNIYDVYQTIAIDKTSGGTDIGDGGKWPHKPSITAANTEIVARRCNFRGYTNPGGGWKKISFANTTFEEGCYTGDDHAIEAYTYNLESTTEGTIFNNCYFKAPFRINIAEGAKMTLEGNCTAQAASDIEKPITVDNDAISGLATKDGKIVRRIRVTSSNQGEPIVRYYEFTDGQYKLIATE